MQSWQIERAKLPAPGEIGARNELPAIVLNAGPAARFAWEEFLFGKIRNQHTRRAYGRAVGRFLGWCEGRTIALQQISPRDVGQYLDELPVAVPTKKQHLAALRHFFDQLVTRHAVVLNPAASVRSERYHVVEGKTPEITVEQARRLLRSIDTGHIVGLRDRAIVGILVYTAARVGAVAKLSVRDYVDAGDQYCLRFTEKGGKSREIPVRHDLQQFISSYLVGRRHRLSPRPMPHFSAQRLRVQSDSPNIQCLPATWAACSNAGCGTLACRVAYHHIPFESRRSRICSPKAFHWKTSNFSPATPTPAQRVFTTAGNDASHAILSSEFPSSGTVCLATRSFAMVTSPVALRLCSLKCLLWQSLQAVREDASDCQIALLCVNLGEARPAPCGHVYSLCETSIGRREALYRVGRATRLSMSDGR